MSIKTISVVIIGLVGASALTACSTASNHTRYAGDPCNPYACAPIPAPSYNPCCYPQPIMYAPPPAPAPYVAPEPPAPVYVAPPVHVEPPVYVAPPVVPHTYPAPPTPPQPYWPAPK